MSVITPVNQAAPSAAHESVLDKAIVLKLNASWQVIGHATVKQSVVSMLSESNGEPPVLALDIEYDENGDVLYMNPTEWKDWINLPVREGDFYIQMKDRRVRVPTVTVARNFAEMPLKSPRLSNSTIFERDKGVCQYTGEYVGKHGGNLDHVVPRDRGGRDSFENLVWCKRELNSRKGNRLNEEAGLKLIRKPVAPKGVPACATIKEAKHPDWKHFLLN
jgi:5-methylcytosine-specific restriction endonuclease McrA